MKLSSFEAVVRALNRAEVKHLVAGGIAVNAYGYGRATYDVDLAIELISPSIQRTFAALHSLGYAPIVPVSAEMLGDPTQRKKLIAEKGMVVLSFASEMHPETQIDLFVSEPFPFQEEYEQSSVQELLPDCPVHLVSLATLVRMKQTSARGKDFDDIENLRLIHGFRPDQK